MSTQPIIPSRGVQLTFGIDARDRGMALALQRADVQDWRTRCIDWVTYLPSGTRFTADDVVAMVGLPSGAPIANGNNALGATLRGLSTQRVILKTEHRVKATRGVSHARELAVWVRA